MTLDQVFILPAAAPSPDTTQASGAATQASVDDKESGIISINLFNL